MSHWWLLSPAFSPVEALNLRRKPICWTFDSMPRYLVIDPRCCKACTAAHYLIYQQRAPASPLLDVSSLNCSPQSNCSRACGESSAPSEIKGSQWGFSRASSASQSSFSKKFSFRNWGVSMTSWKSLPLTANANDKGHGTATLCFSKTKQKMAGWYSYRLRQPGPTNKQDMVPASA